MSKNYRSDDAQNGVVFYDVGLHSCISNRRVETFRILSVKKAPSLPLRHIQLRVNQNCFSNSFNKPTGGGIGEQVITTVESIV